MPLPMDAARLRETVRRMLQQGKLILAADESTKTAGKRLAKVELENTEPNRLGYRRMLLGAKGLEQVISGVILVDETTRQRSDDDTLFPKLLTDRGIVPGVKVDEGLADVPNFPGEQLAKGLDSLSKRLEQYTAESGGLLRFTKWRQTIGIGGGRPSSYIIEEGMGILARYAALCLEHGYVPMVEPEVLMDGDPALHSGQECGEVSKRVLTCLFQKLEQAKVDTRYVILKTNMMVPGKNHTGSRWPPEQVGKETFTLLESVLPTTLPGIAFLSGGMSSRESTANLDAIARAQRSDKKKDKIYTGSFGRALQDHALRAWGGRPENVPAGRAALLEDGKHNSLAQRGEYDAGNDRRA